MIRAVVFDLDGVIRHFLPDHAAEIERRHGLDIGSLDATAFAQPLLTEVTTGRISRAEWVREIGRALAAYAAAEEWGKLTPRPDPAILELADALRSRGTTVAILTNGTDTISDEVEAQGVRQHVDHVFNSATIGHIKPDQRIFQHVIDALGIDGPEIFFTDDSSSKLSGAIDLGFVTHHFKGVQRLREALICTGVL
ncbi:HAD family phosphatase [Arthrobacter sp. PAMC 25486]|uniref:HAD family hydrolase n=1 Tax=Arthrobacter sp. PAMC 25486 TaxID=1494608 RepID=UPI00056E3255|nr:HAD family phosphatase [Arthrobacter sp. PAMC 25486]